VETGGVVVGRPVGQDGDCLKCGTEKETLLNQSFDANQEWVSSERGKGNVRRVTIASARWSERQDLPQALLIINQEIDELIRCGSEVSNTETTR
jgi:hypothetical protein